MNSEICRHKDVPGLHMIAGNNFSGRTNYIHELVSCMTGKSDSTYDSVTPRRSRYIGPEIYNALSGIAATVADEIALWSDKSVSTRAKQLVEGEMLNRCLQQNPFTLSGGEQTYLVAATSFLKPLDCVALDCCLEQLDDDIVPTLLKSIALDSKLLCCYLADNRPLRIACYAEHSHKISEGHIFKTKRPEIVPDERISGPIAQAQIIKVEHLEFAYKSGAFNIHESSTQLDSGRIYHLAGRNGSGKSTFSKILTGILRPHKGQFYMDNKMWRPWEHPASHVAYHFQNPDVQLFSTTAEAELCLAAGISKANDQIMLLAEIFGLTDVMNSHPFDLPFVLRKRLALAVTFAMRRPWMILDEPSLGQDLTTTSAIAYLIKTYVSQGGSALVISHDDFLLKQLPCLRLEINSGRLHGC